jgi:hypothetical protein
MKRLRFTVPFAALAVMMLGVQLVHACEGTIVRYTSAGKYSCWNTGKDQAGNCYYSCTFTKATWV